MRSYSNPEAVLLDMDGTLADSDGAAERAPSATPASRESAQAAWALALAGPAALTAARLRPDPDEAGRAAEAMTASPPGLEADAMLSDPGQPTTLLEVSHRVRSGR